MKSMCALKLLPCVGLIVSLSGQLLSLTPEEQADAFHARGLAAEQRGDLVAAENCYTLALRVVASHPSALSSLAELVEKQPAKLTPTASHAYERDRVEALNDGKEPSSSRDGTIPRFTWYPKKQSFEWVQYDFSKPQSVEGCSVYWFNDNGGVKLPEFWRVLYLDDAGIWMPVDGRPAAPTSNAWNEVRFKSVRTKGLRLATQLGSASAGILEWKIVRSSDRTPQPLPQPDELRLDDLIPIEAKTGWGPMQVNRYSNLEGEGTDRVILDGEPCANFLFAHATSRVSYLVPRGYARFSAIGMSPARAKFKNDTWSYRVLADETPIFESRSLGTYSDRQVPIDVELPAGTRAITLVADANGNSNNDHAIWAIPRLIRSATTAGALVGSPAESDFKSWLKTVQLKQGKGDGVVWSFDEGVVLHFSPTAPDSKPLRFKILAIDPETRIITWQQPDAEMKIRLDPDLRRFAVKWPTADFVEQPLSVEPRDETIFGPPPAP